MIIDKFFPKSCDNIVEYDVIKKWATDYIEPQMLDIIRIMKDDSHIQTMTRAAMAELGDKVFGNATMTNQEFLDKINASNTYTEAKFHDDFYAWTQDDRTKYTMQKDEAPSDIYEDTRYGEYFYKDPITRSSKYGGDYPSPVQNNNVIVVELFGLDADDDVGNGYPSNKFFDSISSKLPLNIAINFFVNVDLCKSEQLIPTGFCVESIEIFSNAR